ncbi:MAG: GumC family protein [Desulfobacteraceae bacterium]
MATPVSNTEREEEVYLLDYLVVLAKHSGMIIYTSAAMAALTLLILLLTPNKYTATARVLPPQQNLTLSSQLLEMLGGSTLPTSASSGLSGLAAGMLGFKSPGEVYVGMLCGNNIADRIIERFRLRDDYRSWLSSGEPYIEDVRENLRKNLEIKTEEEGLISVAVTDEDPQRAAAMANAFIEELDKLLQRMAHQEAKDRLEFLEQERRQASQNLSAAEEAVRAFSEKSKVIQIDDQTRGMIEYIASLRAAIDAKEVQLRVLRQQATPYNFDVIQLETELKGLRERLENAETQADQTCIGDICIPTSKVPALGLEYIRLYREVKYQEGLYQLYTRMVEIARIDLLRDSAVVQAVDNALPPEKKSRPKRLLISMAVGFGVFFLMIFMAVVYEYCQQTVNNEADNQRVALLKSHWEGWRTSFNQILSLFSKNKN